MYMAVVFERSGCHFEVAASGGLGSYTWSAISLLDCLNKEVSKLNEVKDALKEAKEFEKEHKDGKNRKGSKES